MCLIFEYKNIIDKINAFYIVKLRFQLNAILYLYFIEYLKIKRNNKSVLL